MWETLGRVMALALLLGLFTISAGATTPDEKQQFTVTGVEVDVTAADAAQARLKAIEEAQVKAFAELAKRLAGEGGGAVMATLPPVYRQAHHLVPARQGARGVSGQGHRSGRRQ